MHNWQIGSLWNYGMRWIKGVCGNVCKTPLSWGQILERERQCLWRTRFQTPAFSPQYRPCLWLTNTGLLPADSQLLSGHQLGALSSNSGMIVSILRHCWVQGWELSPPNCRFQEMPFVSLASEWGALNWADALPFLGFISLLEYLKELTESLYFTDLL